MVHQLHTEWVDIFKDLLQKASGIIILKVIAPSDREKMYKLTGSEQVHPFEDWNRLLDYETEQYESLMSKYDIPYFSFSNEEL